MWLKAREESHHSRLTIHEELLSVVRLYLYFLSVVTCLCKICTQGTDECFGPTQHGNDLRLFFDQRREHGQGFFHGFRLSVPSDQRKITERGMLHGHRKPFLMEQNLVFIGCYGNQ